MDRKTGKLHRAADCFHDHLDDKRYPRVKRKRHLLGEKLRVDTEHRRSSDTTDPSYFHFGDYIGTARYLMKGTATYHK